MRDFMTRGGSISVDHLSELHRAADDLGGETLRVDPAADMPAWPDVGGGVDDPVPFGPAEAAEGGPACKTHAGSGEGKRAAHGAAMGLPGHVVMAPDAASAVMLAAASHFAALLDWSVAEAAKAGPMPLASGEPYREADDAYAERIGCGLAVQEPFKSTLARHGKSLDALGLSVGPPRARFVPAEG